MAIGAKREVGPERRPRRIEAGRSGERHWWRVGGGRIDLSPGPAGWVASVRRADWDGQELVVDGPLFPDEADAIAWCRRMAEVLRSDLEDDEDGPPT
jgi:hypothetical protein